MMTLRVTSCLEVVTLPANTLGETAAVYCQWSFLTFIFFKDIWVNWWWVLFHFFFFFLASQSLVPSLVSAGWWIRSLSSLPVWDVALRAGEKKEEESRRHPCWLVTVWHQVIFRGLQSVKEKTNDITPPIPHPPPPSPTQFHVTALQVCAVFPLRILI